MILGTLLVDKPIGPTSHDIVDVIRRGTGLRRVGHAGTLDPLASGLLVICLGSATRLSEYLLAKDKRYTARVRFGQSTNTYDAAGRIMENQHGLPAQAEVEAALEHFRGDYLQRPPNFSAIRRGGERSYDRARRGEEFDLEPRTVQIYKLEMSTWEPPFCDLEVHCSAGTYIRSLAHDMGQALGCGAHLAGLRRIASGNFKIDQAVTLETLQGAFIRRDWKKYVLAPDVGLNDWPVINIPAELVKGVQNGNPIPLKDDDPTVDWARGYTPAGEFIAVLRADYDTGIWQPHKVLAN